MVSAYMTRKAAAALLNGLENHTEFIMHRLDRPSLRYMARDLPNRHGRRFTFLDRGTEIFDIGTSLEIMNATKIEFSDEFIIDLTYMEEQP